MAHQSINSFDNRLLKSFNDITDAQLETKLTAVAACCATWKRTSDAHRARIVAHAAALPHEQTDHFAHIMTMEMSKRIN
jgi:succinate-semialdehyde dehydrogenase/glutarate-semialdehyde dehydrogenase